MDTKLNRRMFVQFSTLLGALGGAGKPVGNLLAETLPAKATAMAGTVTEIAIVDDCSRLALYTPGVSDLFKAGISPHRDLTRLGALIPSGHKSGLLLLDEFRERRGASDVNLTEKRAALASGWLFQRAAERQMEQVFRSLGDADPEDAAECRIYHDVVIFRDTHLSRTSPVGPAGASPDMGTPSPVSAEVLEDLFNLIGARLVIGLHTFAPDGQDVNGWMRRLVAWQRAYKELFYHYAEVYRAPAPDKLRRFVAETNFYNREDALIRLARSMQRGAIAPRPDVDAALEAAGSQSHYATALRQGQTYLRAASAYMDGAIARPALLKRLDITATA